MREPARDMKTYRSDLADALTDTFQRKILDTFAVAYRDSRKKMFAGEDERALIADIAAKKDAAIQNLDALYAQFKTEAEKRGVQVHLAKDAAEANRIIVGIAKDNACHKVVKSKSMTVEEIQTNTALEAEGVEVVETDLAEWIIQLRHEGPSHMVLPAIHLSRTQVAGTFSEETGVTQSEDITSLVRVARRELRRKFVEADMGISGANFAIAENGAIGLVTNEGNARLVTTLPRVHVAVCGIDKLIPVLDDAVATLRVLPRNATGQYMTSYVSWIDGATPTGAVSDHKKIMHVVFIDNGRLALRSDPLLSQVLRCVRCGACANVCPVFRLVGGHRMGYIYIGAIGLILTYVFHGKDRAKALMQNCVNCQACKDVCSAGIDLPKIIEELRMRMNEDDGAGLQLTLLSATLKNRKLFHTLLRFAKYAQKPLTGGEPFIRHLPSVFAKDHSYRALPAIAEKAFRDRWETLEHPVSAKPALRVGIFAGCVQDFVYPEQLEAALKLMRGHNISV
ncbi:MAG: lactate utilization protein B, partial [Bilophila sp.]